MNKNFMNAGYATELRNCLEEARVYRAHYASDARVLINAALAAGKFVVVENAPYYCKATDAFAGVVPSLVSAHATRAEADAAAQLAYGDGNTDSDFEVLPRLPLQEIVPTAEDEALPF